MTQVTVQGTLRSDGAIELDEKPAIPPGRVLVTLQPLAQLPNDDPFWQRMQAIWDAQKASGHVPRSVEEVEAERRATRDEWEKRMDQIERIQAEGRAARAPGGQSE